MARVVFRQFNRRPVGVILLLAWLVGPHRVLANPTGGTVAQGTASFSSSGSQFTVNQTSANAFINWQTFNIAAGETTTFNQPSASSVAWNYINDSHASSLDGILNANGYVVLQNPNGFTVGGSAAITAHGLVMTTASTPNLTLSSGGAWTFDAPPPSAQIINYGKINITGGGSAYLIASDIQNSGTISAPNGSIGLYAGKQVLVSMSPDGRGLSAQVTLPQGTVDNHGNLIADAGSIAAQAQIINQNGLVQANSVRNVNGTIELVASDAVNLGAESVLSAAGDAQGVSAGGAVTVKSGNLFSDQIGSTINISGGAQGGNGGQAEISAPQLSGLNSSINGQALDGFSDGSLAIDPANIWLASANTDPAAPAGYSVINVNSFSGLSQISLQADNNLTLNTPWSLASQSSAATLNLSAGNNITLNNGSSINAQANWSVNLTAGTAFSGTTVTPGNDGIYLNGSSFIQTQNGDIDLQAANEVIVNGGAVRTVARGNIDVTAERGNVNSGNNSAGFNWLANAPYYTPSPGLGGISTAAGGNVTINAGGDVNSFSATTPAAGDPGTGAFGPQSGNVTINAGGSVYGSFVLVNGVGSINAGQNIGIGPSANNPGVSERDVALSLVKGGWNLTAQNDIYLQEVRNPNGVFNNKTVTVNGHRVPAAGNHRFDYDPQASVTLTAGDSVNLTGIDIPRPNDPVPMLLPPILAINAGAGGVNLQSPIAVNGSGTPLNGPGAAAVTFLDDSITLFPSPYANLEITTANGGGLRGANADGTATTLLMSDSGLTQWYNATALGSSFVPFGVTDHANVPPELNNYQPATLHIDGNLDNVTLQVDKPSQIWVGGNLTRFTFYGENLRPADVTSITVVGNIDYASSFTPVILAQAFPDLVQLSQSLPAGETYLPPGTVDSWFAMLAAAINPSLINNQSYLNVPPQTLVSDLSQALMFPGFNLQSSLAYDPSTKTLTAVGPLSSDALNILESPTLTLVRYGPNGYPVVDTNPNDPNYGKIETDTIPWVPAGSANASLILNQLYTPSQQAPALLPGIGGMIVGGPGEFDVSANAINLGNSSGILSVGNIGGNTSLGRDYSFLTPYLTSGATMDVTAGTLEMPSSTIASFGGGDVNVTCTGIIADSPQNKNGVGVSMDLGSQALLPFEGQIMGLSNIGLGIYSAGGGNVKVIAPGSINVDSSRIGSFDGGDVFIESLLGDVNAGSGGTLSIPINVASPNFDFNTAGAGEPFEYAFANGIVADTLTALPDGSLVPGAATVPGNITVLTPRGNIVASLGGILQESLSGSLPPGSSITLEAGTPNPPGDWTSKATPIYLGDVDLGNSGAIGGSVVVKATGKVSGLLISQQNADVTSQTVNALTVLAGGTANVSVQSGGAGITIIGGQGVNASGLGSGATLLGQNVSVNGAAAQSTLGNSATATAASQSAAGQTSSENQQQVAGNDNGNDDDKKRKKAEVRRISRVTVILSTAIPRR